MPQIPGHTFCAMKCIQPLIMLRSIYILLATLFISGTTVAQEKLPVPPDSKNRLFFLQRDPNANTVVYDINYTATGAIDAQKPVKVYWIKYATKAGATEALLPIEEKLAYGVITELADAAAKVYKMNLVAYKKLDIFLKPAKSHTKAYHAEVTANGRTLQLQKVFLRLENPASLKPKLLYIEFTGKDIRSGKMVTEKVIPESI